MKEFMEKLFSSQYFVVILFAAIGILALLFIIVLIMALKDAKKNKRAQALTQESDQAEKMADVAFASVSDEPVKVETKGNNEVVEKPDDVVEIKATNNNTFDDIKVDAPTEMSNNEEKTVFPDLNVTKPDNNGIEIVNDVNNFTNDEEVKTEEPVLKPQQPEQFSSVYVTPSSKEEVNKSDNNIPDFSDIPMPTPIQVVNSAGIIDSSKQNVENTPTEDVSKSSEEYNIK